MCEKAEGRAFAPARNMVGALRHLFDNSDRSHFYRATCCVPGRCAQCFEYVCVTQCEQKCGYDIGCFKSEVSVAAEI